MRRKQGGAIAQLKQQTETLTLRMQFFHLDPKWKDFLEICDCAKLRNEQSYVYDIWRLGCLTTYGVYWVEQYCDHPMLDPDARAKYLEEFTDLEEKLIKKLNSYPNSTALDQIWYLYFATGDYKYLKAAFEVAGHDKTKPGLREDAITMYSTIEERYAEKITEALQHDPKYFDNHDCYTVRSAKYNWDRLKAEIGIKSAEINETGDAEIDEILSEVKEYKFTPSEQSEQSEHDKKISRGVDAFNRVLTRLKEDEFSN